MEITKNDLKKEILDMATVVEEALGQLHCFDGSKNVYHLEDQINRYHNSVDDLCFKYLALMRPLAKDLRAALAIMKMNNDLERIGDEVINIHLLEKGLSSKELRPFLGISQKVVQMVKDSIDCFVTKNVKMAMNIIESDQLVDQMHKNLIQTLINDAGEQTNSKQIIFQLVFISKGLERIGDHATNIAEDVIFMVSGDDVRHSESMKQRVKGQIKGETLSSDDSSDENEQTPSIVNFLKKKGPLGD